MSSDDPPKLLEPSQPQFMEHAKSLMTDLKKLDVKDIEALMKVSTAIAEQAQERCAEWDPPFTNENAKPAAVTFKGAVYTGLNARSWSAEDMEFAQGHLRILSGLYGLLRPKDLMQPYRLEMGLKWPNTEAIKNLYAFWGNQLEKTISAKASGVVVNLASHEYSKAGHLKSMDSRVITPIFKDLVKGEYKALMAYAKEARGSMANFIIQNRITEPEEIKGFVGMGYRWDSSLSDANTWLFTRDKNSLAL